MLYGHACTSKSRVRGGTRESYWVKHFTYSPLAYSLRSQHDELVTYGMEVQKHGLFSKIKGCFASIFTSSDVNGWSYTDLFLQKIFQNIAWVAEN